MKFLLPLLIIFLSACGPSEEFIQAREDLALALSDVNDLSNEKRVLLADLDQVQKSLSSLESTIVSLESTIVSIESEIDQKSAQIFENEKIFDALLCEQPLTGMKYDTILNATSRLEAYVNGIDGVQYTSGGYRDSLWDNADSKVHAIRYYWEDGSPYSMQFLVYFDELGFTESTLFIDGQCWVDPPVNIP